MQLMDSTSCAAPCSSTTSAAPCASTAYIGQCHRQSHLAAHCSWAAWSCCHTAADGWTGEQLACEGLFIWWLAATQAERLADSSAGELGAESAEAHQVKLADAQVEVIIQPE